VEFTGVKLASGAELATLVAKDTASLVEKDVTVRWRRSWRARGTVEREDWLLHSGAVQEQMVGGECGHRGGTGAR